MAFRLCYEEAARGKKVKVSTGAANEPAIRLYKQLGFAETGRIEVAPGIFLTNMERSVPDK
jgi:FR47-like protein.